MERTDKLNLAQDKDTDLSKPLRQYLHTIESHASALRRELGIHPLLPFDPRSVAEKYGVKFVQLDELAALLPEDRLHLVKVDAKVWSGAGLPLPDKTMLLILHPEQTIERETITIMEEIAHAYFKHEPTKLSTIAGGMTKREYHPDTEKQAYWTAASTLLPSKIVAKSVWQRQPAEDLAKAYGVSTELVIFRIKILGLWSEYSVQPSASRKAA